MMDNPHPNPSSDPNPEPTQTPPLLRHEFIPQSRLARTPDFYWQAIDPEMRASFTPGQTAAIRAVLSAALPKPAPKIVDLRFSVDLILARFYVVLFVGPDRRQQQRSHFPEPMARLGNGIAAILLLISLNLLVSLVILLFLYLIKSAIGIDLVPAEHLADQLEKLN
jgi:hypothetical protein